MGALDNLAAVTSSVRPTRVDITCDSCGHVDVAFDHVLETGHIVRRVNTTVIVYRREQARSRHDD